VIPETVGAFGGGRANPTGSCLVWREALESGRRRGRLAGGARIRRNRVVCGEIRRNPAKSGRFWAAGIPNGAFGRPNEPVGIPNGAIGIPKDAVGIPNGTIGLPNEPIGIPNEPVGLPIDAFGRPKDIFGLPNEPVGRPKTLYSAEKNWGTWRFV